jgi:hypothetical protein
LVSLATAATEISGKAKSASIKAIFFIISRPKVVLLWMYNIVLNKCQQRNHNQEKEER